MGVSFIMVLLAAAAGMSSSDMVRLEITTFFTVFGGLVVFAGGQLLLKFVLEPILVLRGVIGEVEAALTMYAPTYSAPPQVGPDGQLLPHEGPLRLEARAKLLEVASKLSAAGQAIPWGYAWAVGRGLIPPREEIRRARRQLIVISGLTSPVRGPGGNLALGPASAQQVREALRLPLEDE